nr:hypothetical protein [Tanacetum cinerariifolium]
ITLVDPANLFVSPMAGEIVMDFVNELGYPETIHLVSYMHVNNLPSVQLKDDASANIIRDTPSPTDAEIGADTDKTTNKGDTKIVNIGGEQGEDNLDAYTYGDQFFNEKPTEEDLGKINMLTEVESMFTVLIHQASFLVPPLSTPVIDLIPPKHVPSTTQAPIFTATTTTKTTTTTLPPPPQQQSYLVPNLASRVSALEQVYVPQMINQIINEVVKEVVYVALQTPLRDRFRELPKADMKDILHQWMFDSGFYKLLPEHVASYEALEAFMERANRDEFLVEK